MLLLVAGGTADRFAGTQDDGLIAYTQLERTFGACTGERSALEIGSMALFARCRTGAQHDRSMLVDPLLIDFVHTVWSVHGDGRHLALVADTAFAQGSSVPLQGDVLGIVVLV